MEILMVLATQEAMMYILQSTLITGQKSGYHLWGPLLMKVEIAVLLDSQ